MGSAVFTAVSIYSVHRGQSTDMWFLSFGDVTFVLRVCYPQPRLSLLNQLTESQQMFYAQMILYTTTRFFVRASIILFYLRVFPPRSDNKLGRVVQFTMLFNIVYNISFLFAVIFQCFPISVFWTQWEGVHEGHCGNFSILAWVAAATGIAFDLWLLALPFSQLLALNLHWKKKVMGGLMFFVGVA